MKTPIRAAFYYPWYPQTWPFGTHYHPTLGQYDSTPEIFSKHIELMQLAGIQAGIASWWDPGSVTDTHVAELLEAAAATSFRWALYYELESVGDPTVQQIEDDLAYILEKYAHHRGYLKVDRRPVIFVYSDDADAAASVDRWTTANAGRFYDVLKVFEGFRDVPNQPDSWHQYAPASAAESHLPYSYAISPGFWKADEPAPRLDRDPARFQQNVTDMVASGAQWQLITTFNEWGEGTAIEPSEEWGRTYLRLLRGVQ